MSKVTVEFRKSIEVDLNAYYENFPKGLRESINEAIFKLLGGQPATSRVAAYKRGNGRHPVSAVGIDSFVLTGEPIQRVGSKAAVYLHELKEKYGDSTMTKEDVVKCIEAVARRNNFKSPSAVIHNLVRGRYLRAAG